MKADLTPDLWRRLSQLLLATESLGEAERHRLMQEAVERDPEMGRHLSTFLRAADRVQDSQIEVFSSPRHGRWDDPPSLGLENDRLEVDLEGAELGPYRLGPCIGRGGMGEVYLADRIDGELERQVAIKVLRAGLDPRAEGLFAEERRILASLEHASIARLYDAGHTSERLAYLVMEYVQGEPIDQFCRRRSLPLGERLRLFGEVCRAVDFAHRKMVLHRDLKPGNILVQASGEPKLLDFGISRWLDGAGRRQADDLADGSFTPAFASPEQMSPGQPLGIASDVFSLGKVLEYLLRDLPETDPRRVIPVDLSAIVARATDPSADGRYVSAEQLAQDLDRFQSGHPVIARDRTLAYVAGRFIRRNRLAVAVSVPMILWMMVSLALLMFQRVEIVAQRDEARILAASAEEERQAVLRLSDTRRLRLLKNEAEQLWPIHPDRAPAMAAWLTAARELVERRELHRRALFAVERRLEIAADGSRLENLTEQQVVQLAWQKEILEGLVGTLDAWNEGPDPAVSLVDEIADRWQRAESLARRSIDTYPARWQEAVELVPGLRPQVGLVPLGADPGSGLLELAVLGTGMVPQRSADGRLILSDDFAIVLVLLPGGSFFMGSQQEDPSAPNFDPQAELGRDSPQPPVEVAMEPFLISKFELTQAQWAAISGGQWPSRHNAETGPFNDEELATKRHPVEQVSWKEADLRLRRFNLRLPTEAQWEYGARAGTETPWWPGSDLSSLNGVANLADRHLKDNGGNPEWSYSLMLDDGYYLTAPVGSFRPNAFGLHDVHGNVSEWCDGNPEVAANYQSSPDVRTARGGSWWYTAQISKVTYRLYGTETNAIADLGVRPARPLDP